MKDPRPQFSKWVDEFASAFRWHNLPKLFGLKALLRIRNELEEQNLYDTEHPPLNERPDHEPIPEEKRKFRSEDGRYNDLQFPRMGAAGARFGRNVPLDRVHPDTARLMIPNPREISRQVLARDEFIPAEIINLLAAAWIQFQVHDWFTHKEGPPDEVHEIPIPDGDSWGGQQMKVPKTPPEPTAPGQPPAYANLNTHWWDASQIYGSNQTTASKLRTFSKGMMKLGDAALLPLDIDGVELTGFANNWWVGLSLMHSVFVAEHNAICMRLLQDHPDWDDETLYQHARLINAALMAKIHTVEWTPAILPHPTVASALRINWSGFVGEDLQEILRFLDESVLLGGIVGTQPNHHGVPYSLTEEFVAVYRMHPLLPDDYEIRSLANDIVLGEHTLTEMSLSRTRSIMETYSLPDLLYSFGVAHPGALTLHNYPNHLRDLRQQNGTRLDLAAVDILRDRERGVPRYNEFRECLRLDRIGSFDELTQQPEWAEQLRSLYGGDIDQVDLMVGLFAEPLLPGFGFSETAFRIFILMASRRLQSDRFLTSDYREEVYTEAGLEWIKNNSMVTVLLRHHPSLAGALAGAENAFQPWKRASA